MATTHPCLAHPGQNHRYLFPLQAGISSQQSATFPDILNVCIDCAKFYSPVLQEHCAEHGIGEAVTVYRLSFGDGNTLHYIHRFFADGKLTARQESPDTTQSTIQSKYFETSNVYVLYFVAVELDMYLLRNEIVSIFGRVCAFTRGPPQHGISGRLYCPSDDEDVNRRISVMTLAFDKFRAMIRLLFKRYGGPLQFTSLPQQLIDDVYSINDEFRSISDDDFQRNLEYRCHG